MSLNTSTDTFPAVEVNRNDSFIEQAPVGSSDATLVNMMAKVNLEDNSQHATRDSNVAKRKTLFDVTKFTRGKAKGGVGLLPWLGYFVPVCLPGVSTPEIYVWLINSENNSSIYHMNQQSRNLEFHADGTQSFHVSGIDYLPDVLNRKLYIPGFKPARVIIRTLDDAQAERSRIWAEELNRYIDAVATPVLEGGHPQVSGSVESADSQGTSHNPVVCPAQPSAASCVPPQAPCHPTPGSSSQTQSFATTANTVTLPSNVIKIPVPSDVTTSKELEVYTTEFKTGYKSRGDKSLQVVCGRCGAIQNDLRPSSLARHLATHLEIKDYKCDKCAGAFVTAQQLERHRGTRHKVHVSWFAAKMPRRNG